MDKARDRFGYHDMVIFNDPNAKAITEPIGEKLIDAFILLAAKGLS